LHSSRSCLYKVHCTYKYSVRYFFVFVKWVDSSYAIGSNKLLEWLRGLFVERDSEEAVIFAVCIKNRKTMPN